MSLEHDNLTLISRTTGMAALVAVSLTTFASPVHAALDARRLAILAGGSGEPDNFFVKDLKELRSRLEARGWKVRSEIGARATNRNISQGIRSVLSSARAGDEVLVLFHSHGHEREPDWGQKTHSVTSENMDSTGLELGFDLDEIEPRLERAKARGVHTALVDLSCYSGTSQAIQGTDCTVTLAAPNYVSLCSGRPEERHFTSRFIALPAPDTKADLESWFLEARSSDTESINLPQISSRQMPALAGWSAFLEAVDPLDVFEDIQKLRTGAKPFNPARLLGPVDASIARRKDTEIRDLIERRLKTALSSREAIEKAMPAMAHAYDERSLRVRFPDGTEHEFSPGALSDLLDHFAERGFSPKKLDGYDQAQRAAIRALFPIRNDVSRRYRQALADFRSLRDRYNALADRLASASDELFAAERQLYNEAARPVPSACSRFSL